MWLIASQWSRTEDSGGVGLGRPRVAAAQPLNSGQDHLGPGDDIQIGGDRPVVQHRNAVVDESQKISLYSRVR